MRRAADLCAFAERMRIHSHDPVRRIDSIVAASSADVCVTRKNRAMQHQHVLAEHEHACRTSATNPESSLCRSLRGSSDRQGRWKIALTSPSRGRRVKRGADAFHPPSLKLRRTGGANWTHEARDCCWTLDVGCLGVERFSCATGVSFIPHFGQLPG